MTAHGQLHRSDAATAARATFAAAALPAPGVEPGAHAACRLGAITLLPHQRDAVSGIFAAFQEFGGALLADQTGLGKTYVALGVAASARRPLIVAPAALLGMWHDALERTGVTATLTSAERLSRNPTDQPLELGPDLVIVDEAQHFRGSGTRRYGALARLTRSARVLLLSATPVHNRVGELHRLLALFAGARAATLDDAALARCIIRRSAAAMPDAARPPLVAPLRWLVPMLTTEERQTHDGLLEEILALPPSLPAADGGDGGALLAHGLVRQWSSSIGALHGALRRRLVRAEALLAALETGHHLAAAELRRWVVGDDAVQLDLPGLLAPPHQDLAPLRPTVVRHRDALLMLLTRLHGATDAPRAAVLRELRVVHAGVPIVAFAQFADTVDACYRELARDGGVCALHGDGARVAGGLLTRDDALRRFAPRAHGVAPPPAAERISLLLTTDVLSEGVNLQDAAVVVHLDLPWTAARLEQRVGRVARIGSVHDRVHAYAMAPPATAERLLGVERRLRAKWREAGRVVGVSGIVLPDASGLFAIASADRPRDGWLAAPQARDPGDDASAPATATPSRLVRPAAPAACFATEAVVHAGGSGQGDVAPDGATAPPEANAALQALLRRWRAATSAAADREAGSRGTVALVHSGAGPAVFLAVVQVGARPVLLGGRADQAQANDDPGLLLRIAQIADVATECLLPDPDAATRWARRQIDRWHRGRAAGDALALVTPGSAPIQRQLLQRLGRIVRRAPMHQRPLVLPLAAAARRVLTRPLGAGAERVLAELAASPLGDVAWLQALGAFADAAPAGVVERGGGLSREAADGEPAALLVVLGREGPLRA